MTGAAAQGALAATKTGTNIETSEMRMNTSTIDGMQLTRSFNIKDKSGAILVALGDSGLFSVSFRGMRNQKFNWKLARGSCNRAVLTRNVRSWISQSGAKIVVATGSVISTRFELAFGAGRRRACDLIWRQGNILGVRF